MKTIIAISLLAVSLAGTSAFGQGYFAFTSSKSQAYDGFTTPAVSALGTTVNTSFLWAPASTVPAISAFLSQTPKTGTNGTPETYTAAAAWGVILNGQFTLAVNDGSAATVVAPTSSTGVINYNPGAGAGAAFPVTGTSAGTTYTIYEISWSSAFATPQLAQSANGGLGSAVGWSTPFQYAAVTQTGFVNSMNGQAASFGTFVPGAVPEPTTLALAGLGGLAALLFRRRK